MNLGTRTLADVCKDINDTAISLHQLRRRQEAGEGVVSGIAAAETRLEQLYAEKRWLQASTGAFGFAGPVLPMEGYLRGRTLLLPARSRRAIGQTEAL